MSGKDVAVFELPLSNDFACYNMSRGMERLSSTSDRLCILMSFSFLRLLMTVCIDIDPCPARNFPVPLTHSPAIYPPSASRNALPPPSLLQRCCSHPMISSAPPTSAPGNSAQSAPSILSSSSPLPSPPLSASPSPRSSPYPCHLTPLSSFLSRISPP